MRRIQTLSLLLISLQLIVACGSNPALQSPAPSTDQNNTSSQTTTSQSDEAGKSIVPDINEPGRRGQMARKMLAVSTRQFLTADNNRDYLISKQEAAENLQHISKNFSRYDKNEDGFVTWQEMLRHDKWPQPVHQQP